MEDGPTRTHTLQEKEMLGGLSGEWTVGEGVVAGWLQQKTVGVRLYFLTTKALSKYINNEGALVRER